MEKKLLIEIVRKLPFDELSARTADASDKIDSGSASCITASIAAALAKRASYGVSGDSAEASDRIEYIRRNTEIIRDYMDHLIDEDIRCRGPLKKAFKDGDPRKISACCQPACAIAEETADMMRTLLGFCDELVSFYKGNIPHYVFEAATLAYAAVESSAAYIDSVTKLSDDATYIYITDKEMSIFRDECLKLREKVYSAYSGLAAYEGSK